MRNLILALVMFFLISIPNLLFAAEFSPLDASFPDRWVKAQEYSCTPKTGIEIKTTSYVYESLSNVTKIVMLQEKNGVVFFQSKIFFSEKGPGEFLVEIKRGDEVFTFKNKEIDIPKFQVIYLEASELTIEELIKCNF